LEHNLPLAAYSQSSIPNINSDKISSNNNVDNNNNSNNNLNQNSGKHSSRNKNGVYSNIVKNVHIKNNKNTNNDLVEIIGISNSAKENPVRRVRSDNISNLNDETLKPETDKDDNNNNNYNNNYDKNSSIYNHISNPNNDINCKNQHAILDKNIAAYGNKCYTTNNDRDTLIFDPNGGEYSPKNSMILNFNSISNKKNLEFETLISTKEPKNKKLNSENNNNNKDNNNNNDNKLNIQTSPEIDLMSEMRSDSEKIQNTNLKQQNKIEDASASENFDAKSANYNNKNNNNFNHDCKAARIKLRKPARATSAKGSAYTNESASANLRNSLLKKNNNTKNDARNYNPIKTFDGENKKNNDTIISNDNRNQNQINNNDDNYTDNSNNTNNNRNRSKVTKTNNLRSVSKFNHNEHIENSNDLQLKNILEKKNINSVLTNIREKSLNIFPVLSTSIKNNKNNPSSSNNISKCISENNCNNNNDKTNKENSCIINNSEAESELYEDQINNDNNSNSIKTKPNKSKNLNLNNLIENFNHKSFELTEPEDFLTPKKGGWYSLDYIESHDYLVCGFENGEIVIFKASEDHSMIRTYRPRFKRIRKLLYSAENSSVFVCYDDGFFITINILDFKFESYKKSDNQIYTFDIMKNYNILVWGGYDKKIMFSHINNLDSTQLFWESKHGEIQALYHDLTTDVLIASFRKNKVAFFNFKNTQVIKQFNIEENDDACGMVIKKYEAEKSNIDNIDDLTCKKKGKKSTILISGYFMCIHQFEISLGEDNKEKVDFIRYIRTPYTHIYDILFLNQRYFLISTFEEGKIVLLDFLDNKIIKVFEHFYKAVLQIKFVKDKFYLTSHGDYLKKVEFNM